MSAPLDPEVGAALASAGFRVGSYTLVSAIRSPEARKATYRIDLEDGRTIKARLVRDPETARRLFAIRREIPAGFAPAFDRRDGVLLEEWIEGTVLDGAAGVEHGSALDDGTLLDGGDGALHAPLDTHVAQAASLLARLHATPAVLGEPVLHFQPTAPRRDDTEHGLARIVAAGALPDRIVQALRAALADTDPGEARVGLVHTDLCGENIVVDPAGCLHVVDNERLEIDALGYDLGRVWYRWPLASRQWQVFRSAYAAAARSEEQLASFAFWSVVAVVKSAELRLRLDRDRAHVPLARLRRMAAALGEPR